MPGAGGRAELPGRDTADEGRNGNAEGAVGKQERLCAWAQGTQAGGRAFVSAVQPTDR